MPDNFIIFFSGKEGTSPLIRLLSNFETISVVHQVGGGGWEPFDRHNCGPMPLPALRTCLDMIYGARPLDMERLNAVYTATGKKPLAPIDTTGSIGFKMRFHAPGSTRAPLWSRIVRRLTGWRIGKPFRQMMIGLLKKHRVVVFVTARQDLLRMGLSMYRGDGTGRPGHAQFKLATGQITRDELGAMHVDCDRLQRLVHAAGNLIQSKEQLTADLRQAGVPVFPLRYEEFLADKPAYFRRFCDLAGIGASDADIRSALDRGAHFEKVHPDDISQFVVNHEEVLARFDNCFVPFLPGA